LSIRPTGRLPITVAAPSRVPNWFVHMRVVRNIGHVKRRRRFARLSSLVGLVFLLATFPLVFLWNNSSNLVIVAYVLLFVGFILFNMGMQQLGKWSNNARHPRNDLALDSRLQSLPDKFALIHFPKLGKRVVEHLLVHPGGVLVITARDYPGRVTVQGNRWRRSGLGLSRLFGFSGPQLGNPSIDTEQGIAAVEQVLAAGQQEVDVSGVVVFISPMVQLDLDEPGYPTMRVEDLPGYVRSLAVDPSFRATDRDALVALLGQGEEIELPQGKRTRRPVKVKRRAA
jgi:Nuclease-related domain